jgi:4-amino-4-deoxy-L-arabinose transferase-like glycosyltransferase
MFGPRAAVCAGLVWITMQFVVEQFRIATADPYLTFFTLLSVWAWVARLPLLTYIALGFGMLAKGPVIFVTVVPAIVALQVFSQVPIANRKSQTANHLAGIVLFLLIALPWYLYVYLKIPHAIELWRYESIGEISDNVEKARPWWLYLGSIFRVPLPWTPLWIAGIVLAFVHGKRGLRTPRGRRRHVPLVWFASNLLFFSLLNVKKDAYLLPVIPAMVLTIADALTILLAWARRVRFRDVPGVLATTQAAIGIGAAAVVLALLWKIHTDRIVGIIAGVAALIVALYALRPIARERPAQWLAVQCIAYAITIIALMSLQRPEIENARSPRRFAAQLDGFIHATGLPLLIGKLPEEVAFYLPLDLPDGHDASRVLAVVDDNRLEIQRGKRVVDAKFFETWIDDGAVRDVKQIPLRDNGGGRWKLYELIVDRSRA